MHPLKCVCFATIYERFVKCITAFVFIDNISIFLKGYLICYTYLSFSDVHSATVLFNFSIVGFLDALILTMVFDVALVSDEIKGGIPTNPYDWFLCVAIGVLSYAGQFALTVSLQVEAAGIATLMRKAFDIIFSYLFQITIFQVLIQHLYVHCIFFT